MYLGDLKLSLKISKNIYSQSFDEKSKLNDLKSNKGLENKRGRAPKILVCKLDKMDMIGELKL